MERDAQGDIFCILKSSDCKGSSLCGRFTDPLCATSYGFGIGRLRLGPRFAIHGSGMLLILRAHVETATNYLPLPTIDGSLQIRENCTYESSLARREQS